MSHFSRTQKALREGERISMLEPDWRDDCRKEHDLDFEHENPDGTLFYRCLRCWKTFHFDADDAPEK